MPKKAATFDEALNRLEEIVSVLESGEQPLEQCLSLFQEGVKLVKECNTKLENIEASIKILVNENGEMIEKDFKPDEQ